jgi:hypothetical protein
MFLTLQHAKIFVKNAQEFLKHNRSPVKNRRAIVEKTGLLLISEF